MDGSTILENCRKAPPRLGASVLTARNEARTQINCTSLTSVAQCVARVAANVGVADDCVASHDRFSLSHVAVTHPTLSDSAATCLASERLSRQESNKAN